MIKGRGQPGTHDTQLALKCFEGLARINTSQQAIDLPIFDKSRYEGKGDRSEQAIKVQAPLDLVIFEGWAVGFHSVALEELQAKYQDASMDPKDYALRKYGYASPFFMQHSLEHLLYINGKLKEYESLWKFLHCFIQLKPTSMNYVWKWRLEVGSAIKERYYRIQNLTMAYLWQNQQEHAMKARNGGVGMADDEVEAFIGRSVKSKVCSMVSLTLSPGTCLAMSAFQMA